MIGFPQLLKKIAFYPLLALGLLLFFRGFLDAYFTPATLSAIALQGTHLAAPLSPLPDYLFNLEVGFFQGEYLAYLLAPFLLHLVSLCLLFRVALALSNPMGAFFSLLLLAIHPEVSFLLGHPVRGLEEGLALVFLLLCLLQLIRFRKEGGWLPILLCSLFFGICRICSTSTAYLLVPLFVDLARPQDEDTRKHSWSLSIHIALWMVFFLVAALKETFPEIFAEATLSALNMAFQETTRVSLSIGGMAALCLFLRKRLVSLPRSLPLLFLPTLVPLFTPDQAVELNRYLAGALFALWLGPALAAIHGRGEKPAWRAGALLACLGLAIFFAIKAKSAASDLIDSGLQTRVIQERILAQTGAEHPRNEPVFVLDTPPEVVTPVSLVLSPPFSERGLKVYPVPRTPYLGPDLDTPYMLNMWGEGKVLRYVVENDTVSFEEVPRDNPGYLVTYWSRYGQGQKRSLMHVTVPTRGMGIWIQDGAFPVTLPIRKAEKYRVVALTRAGPAAYEKAGLSRDMITKGSIPTVDGMAEKRYITLNFNENLLMEALTCFNGEPVFLWVEILDKEQRVYHRSPLIRFTLFSEKGKVSYHGQNP